MIIDLLPLINARRLMLASASPRRIEILQKIGLNPVVVPSTFPETLEKTGGPARYAMATAYGKALEVWARASPPADILVAADSVVCCNGDAILEKPADASHARAMMQQLSGRSHEVVTGVVVASRTPPPAGCAVPFEAVSIPSTAPAGSQAGPVWVTRFAETTRVTMATLPDTVIDAYVATADPYDKAGGYGLQSLAAQFVSGVEGCPYNVMGFPLHRFCAVLRALLAPEHDVSGDAHR